VRMESHHEPNLRREGLWIFLILFSALLLCALIANGGFRGVRLGTEAIVRTGVASDLLAGEARGRQGLVGSLYWTPIPTILALPVVPFIGGGFGMCIISAAMAGLCAAFINSYLARKGTTKTVRRVVIALFAVQPFVIRSVVSGGSELLFALLTFVAFAYFLDWLDTGSLHSLAYFSIVLGLDILTRFQTILIAVVMFVVLFFVLYGERRGRRSYLEGMLIAFLAPPLYAVAVWFAANWLIMGEWTFFLRGLVHSEGLANLLTEGCPWAVVLLPLVLIATGWWQAANEARRKTAAAVLIIASTVAMVLGLWLGGGDAAHREEIASIARYLEKEHADDRVVVSGYLGYEFRRRLHPEYRTLLVHTMSIYLDDVLERTRGKALYFLVPRPVGAGRWEDMNLKFPGIYERGREFTLFDRRWRDWRLFRVIRLDEPLK